MWLLETVKEGGYWEYGYYTGTSYIYHGARYANISRDATLAKEYSTKAKAQNACDKMKFENHTFQVCRYNKME